LLAGERHQAILRTSFPPPFGAAFGCTNSLQATLSALPRTTGTSRRGDPRVGADRGWCRRLGGSSWPRVFRFRVVARWSGLGMRGRVFRAGAIDLASPPLRSLSDALLPAAKRHVHAAAAPG